jgi:uncharacterized membrane protein (UPF0127 family)
MAWVVRDGEVLASAVVATSRAERRRGLLGRDSLDGALVLRPCRQVHSIGMRFAIDVVWCDAHGRVLRISALKPHRLSRPVWRARFVIEAQRGAVARWRLKAGEVLDITGEEGA